MSNIINKVVYGGTTLIDLTGDTVTASDVMSGVTVHLADGTQVSGTMTATSTPTANTIAKFDSNANMNSSDMSAQEVEDFVDDLNVTGITAVDYIVEQGTSGIWTYRKWNSGIAECWGDTGIVTLSSYGTEFGGKAFTTVVTFPTGLFVSTPQVTYSAHINNNWALTGTIVTSNTSTTTFSLYAISATSVTTNTSTEWWVNAKGRWK